MIKLGLVGYGFMGKTHGDCYAAAGGAQIVAVADAEAERRQEAADKFNCKAFSDIQALLDGSQVDAVDICTPTYLHEEHVLTAAKAGKDIFCEKPLSLTVESCAKMVSAVKSAKAKLMVGHVVRFWPECIVLKEILDSGRLGKPIWASARRLSAPATWAWQSWLQDPARSGGAVLDLHIHDLDFLAWIMGPPKRIISGGFQTKTGAYDTSLTMCLDHQHGGVSQAEGSLAMPDGYPFTMQLLVVCEKGSVIFDLTSQPTLVVRPEGAPEEYPAVPAPAASSSNAGGNVSVLGGYYNEVVYFLECLRENRQPETITPEEAARAVRLCLAARESEQTGKVVSI